MSVNSQFLGTKIIVTSTKCSSAKHLNTRNTPLSGSDIVVIENRNYGDGVEQKESVLLKVKNSPGFFERFRIQYSTLPHMWDTSIGPYKGNSGLHFRLESPHQSPFYNAGGGIPTGEKCVPQYSFHYRCWNIKSTIQPPCSWLGP